MIKKVSAALFSLALSAVFALGCFAAEPGGTVAYNGSALDCSGGMTGFTGMLPGISHSDSIRLENKSGETANFYMDTNVINTLVKTSESQQEAGYTVSLTCGGNGLYGYDPATGASGSLIGGQNTRGLGELNDSLSGYQLIATLKPGETADVVLTITPEAEGMGNAYQNSQGEIKFSFQAAKAASEKIVNTVVQQKGAAKVITQVRYLTQAAQTGDTALVLVAALVLAGAVLAFILLGKKKKNKKEG